MPDPEQIKKRRSTLLFCDAEQAYTDRLVDALGARKGLPFEIRAFTSLEKLEEYLEENPEGKNGEVLLIEEGLAEQFRLAGSVEQMAILVSSRGGENAGYSHTVLKYQALDMLLEEILALFPQRPLRETKAADPGIRDCRFYAVFSPVKRCGKTSFAVAMAGELARNRKTLYLNFEEYPAFGRLYRHEDCELASLLTGLLGNDELTRDVFLANVRQMGEFEYVPPGINHGDLRLLTFDGFCRLQNLIRNEHLYEAVVLDFGDCVEDITSILMECDHIFMPVADDPVSKAKIADFLWVMESLEGQDSVGRLIKVRVPEESIWPLSPGTEYEQSRMYRYVSGVMGDLTHG